MRRGLLALVGTLPWLWGCVTAGESAFSTTPPKAGFAAVYVGRPHGWNTSYIPLSIEISDRPLASLGPGSYTRIEVRPGRYIIAPADTYMTKVTFGIPRPKEFNAQPGKIYYVLPISWVENLRPGLMISGGKYPVATATTEGDRYGSFEVQEKSPADSAPTPFANLSAVAADAGAGG
jgi:hypothetical protein